MKKFLTTIFQRNFKATILSTFCFTFLALHSFAQPTITSFTPASGKIGDTIIITGSGFGTSVTDNIIFFGSVKSTVLAATPTQLTTRVPYGTTYKSLSVTTNNLTGYSTNNFNVTYAEPGGIIPGCIEPARIFPGGLTPTRVMTGDIDGDGKTDAVLANSEARNISIFRNISSANINFDSAFIRQTVGQSGPLEMADFNGDGKMEIVVLTANPYRIKIFKNTSVPGMLSFDTAIEYRISNSSGAPRVGDIDLDGKPDIVMTDADSVCVLRNNSNAASLSFEPKKGFKAGLYPISVEINDIDGNGKPDVVVLNEGANTLSILPNASVPGTIILNSKIDIATSSHSGEFVVNDIDGDSKNDLIYLTFLPDSKLLVYRNRSTNNIFSFDTAVSFPAGYYARSCTSNDIDGDGKVDLILLSREQFWVFKNKSSPGIVSIDSMISVANIFGNSELEFGDFDNDGKADLLSANENRGVFYIFRNKSNEPIISSYTPTSGTSGTVVTIKGLNFHDATTVKFGNVIAGSFTIVSDSVITAIPGAGETGDISVISPKGTVISSEEFGFNIPFIQSFSPESGRLATSVTISGNNFSSVVANNQVYFGGVKATIQSATTTSLTVTVPVGATYQPITVTVNRRTAWSAKPFTVTFPSANTIGISSFTPKTDLAVQGQPVTVAASDFDNDGKPDLAVTNYSGRKLSIFRNTSSGNSISFAPRADIASEYGGYYLATGDLNGDGKQDIVVSNSLSANRSLSIFENTSSTGNISFGPANSDFTISGYSFGVIITDLDGDGKPDIGVARGNTPFISFYRNISRGTAILFAPRVFILAPQDPEFFTTGDLNGDKKPDLIITNHTLNIVSIYRNISTSGTISFAPRLEYSTAVEPYGVKVADMDGDNKPDISVSNYTSAAVSVLKNISVGDSIVFASKIDFSSPAGGNDISVNDIDGDGKLDIATGSLTGNTVAVLKNIGAVGTTNFAPPSLYATGAQPTGVLATDLNGDGTPDLVTANYGSGNISVFRNKLLDSVIVSICPPVANTSVTSNITGSSYQWQVNTGNGFVNVVDNSNYAGSQSLTLQLNNIPSSWHGYQYRCIVNNDYSSRFVLKVRNLWTGAANAAWENPANWSCNVVPDPNTDVIINSGSVVLNSNASCGSITVTAPGSFTINPGFTLTITR